MTARTFIPALAVACLIPLGCDQAPTHLLAPDRPSFITNGVVDQNAHPAVVLIIMDVGGHPAFRCSVIQLATAVELRADQYGKLPTVNQLDALKPRNATRFTAVGYGLQRINPAFVQADRIRMNAEPHLIQINTGFTGSFSLLLSNNASTGGTCFGDSGGPDYLGSSNVIAGVTSFGINGNCAGTGGVFRLDRQDVLDFVRGFLSA